MVVTSFHANIPVVIPCPEELDPLGDGSEVDGQGAWEDRHQSHHRRMKTLESRPQRFGSLLERVSGEAKETSTPGSPSRPPPPLHFCRSYPVTWETRCFCPSLECPRSIGAQLKRYFVSQVLSSPTPFIRASLHLAAGRTAERGPAAALLPSAILVARSAVLWETM